MIEVDMMHQAVAKSGKEALYEQPSKQVNLLYSQRHNAPFLLLLEQEMEHWL